MRRRNGMSSAGADIKPIGHVHRVMCWSGSCFAAETCEFFQVRLVTRECAFIAAAKTRHANGRGVNALRVARAARTLARAARIHAHASIPHSPHAAMAQRRSVHTR
jgi:hypothetical protein